MPAKDMGRTGGMNSPVADVHHMQDDAWDAASAEALTRMYEADGGPQGHDAQAFFLQDPLPAEPGLKEAVVAAAVKALSTDPVAASPADKIIRRLKVAPSTAEPTEFYRAAAAPAVVDHSEVLAALARDREWLDDRIKDIAHRVEDTLARNNPMERIADLDRRFGAFEESFGQAMSEVATRADLESLHEIENQIGVLSKRLDETRTQLRRIDDIDGELRKLSAIAEQAQAGDSAADFAAQSHAIPDVTALVDLAADRVAERFAAMAPPAASTDHKRLDQLQAMLASIAEDRRREEHQTSSMLDTMQEALVRLIDRVDQIDLTRPHQTQALDAGAIASDLAEHAPALAAASEDVVYIENERGPHPGRRQTDQEAYAQSGIRHHDPEQPEVKIQADAAGFPDFAEPPVQAPIPERPVKLRQPRTASAALDMAAAATVASQMPHAQPHQPSQQPQPQPQPQRSRVAEQPAPSATKPVAPRSTRQMAQPTVIAMPDETADDTKAEPSTLAKRGILVAGLGIAIIAAGLLFEFFIKDRFLSGGASKVADRAPVARTATPDAASPQPQGPALTPRFADEPDTPTPAAVRPGEAGPQTQPDPRAAPAPAPGRGAADQPPLNQQPRPRSQLETSNGQLPQSAGQVPAGQVPQTAPVASASSVGAPPSATPTMLGISLQHAAPMPQMVSAPPAPATQAPATQAPAPKPTAQLASPLTTASLPAASPALGSQAAVELPPALIGPLSLRLAAQKGDPEAQFEVAARFAEGKGVKQDFKQAQTWYERSARSGFAPSQYRLGTLFERGVSGTPDVATARQWYERAASEGNLKAMHNLAVLSASAQAGQQPDYAAATQWFAAAADHGLADSQFNLGVLYENGLGVARDPVAAYKWYALAAARGDAEAARRRDAVAARLQPGQSEALADQVSKWRPKAINPIANDARAAGAALRARAEQAAYQAMPSEQPALEQPAPAPSARPAPVRRSAPKTAAQTSLN